MVTFAVNRRAINRGLRVAVLGGLVIYAVMSAGGLHLVNRLEVTAVAVCVLFLWGMYSEV
jgi:hypothetical protein